MNQSDLPQEIGWIAKLYDGTTVRIRPSGPDDAELELEFLNQLPPAFRNSRFLGLVHAPSPEVARELTDLDPAKAVGLIAVVPLEGRDHQIGAAQFYVNTAGDSCDVSLAVSGEWRKRGVGSSLMRRLIDAARMRGIRQMRAYLPEHSDGSDSLATRIGFERRQDLRDPASVVYELDLK